MYLTCLDMEGVLVPEIWIAFAEASGIPELKRTTRDEPDYDKLMRYRLSILKEHHLGLKEIQETIATIDPLPGAKAFLDELRSLTQVIILSDTFEQFAKPLMKKLGWRGDYRVPNALPPVQADHSEGPAVHRLSDYRQRGQLQRSGHDPGQQGGLPLQEHGPDQGGSPGASRL